jgi:hypothetical protein
MDGELSNRRLMGSKTEVLQTVITRVHAKS